MSNFKRQPLPKEIVVGRCSGPNAGCKKHPKHKQSPGVCSLCLRDKLSRLSAASSSSAASDDVGSSCPSSSLTSCYSSSSSSSCSSPVMYRYGFTTSFLSGKNAFMGKSRSLAFVGRRKDGDGNDCKKKEKIRGGFLSKFIFTRSKRKDAEPQGLPV